MLDIKFICENPELVKNNIKRKFKDHKLPLVDEAIALYNEKKDANNRANELRANRNKISKQIGMLMA
ncbi:MAG: serine--tRNA ligase, partial [Clostridia bacterium]|nr:serine--tRNA ligase [Clostridia bacterium]